MAITKASSNAVAPAAKGDLIAGTTTNDSGVLAVGANGTVLTAASGQATGLEWATPVSGSMTLISTTTLSGASIALTSIPQTYKNLKLVIRNFLPATNGRDVLFRFNGDSGANRHFNGASFTNINANAGATTTISLVSGASNSVATAGLINVDVYDYTNAVTWKNLIGYGQSNNSTTTTEVNFRFAWGFYNQTSAVTSITLLPDSGNFTSGTVLLYGVN